MQKVIYKPYVGSTYAKQGFKILALGESHYITEGETQLAGFTQDMVGSYLNYKKGVGGRQNWMNTFTRFSNIFNGRRLNNAETMVFWESIAFYNYVQFSEKAPRQSPSAENFTKSIDALKEVLMELQPDFIIFWGHRLWNNFPKEFYAELKNKETTIHLLEFDKKYPFKVIPHPSSRYLSFSVSAEIKDYVEAAKNLFLNEAK